MGGTAGASWNFPQNQAGKVIGWASDGESLVNHEMLGVDVRIFGAIGDGSADDTDALLAAFADCSSTHKTLIFPPGAFTTTAKLPVTSGFRIIGPGEGDNTSVATQPTYAASILWTGVNNGTDYIIDVKSATSGEHVYGFSIDGIALKGANAAYGGIRFASSRHCQFGKLWVERCRNTHVRIDASNGALSASLQGRYIQIVAGSNAATLNADGLVIHSDGLGNTQINIDRIAATTQSGHAVDIGDLDSSVFHHIQAGAVDSNFHGLYLRGPTNGNLRASRKNYIGWFAGGSAYAEDGSKNVIGWVNSEGTSVTCEAGASLDYSVIDRRNGRRFSSHRQCIDDKYELEMQLGKAHTGSPVIGTVGAQGASGVLFDAASTESWQWTFRPPRNWHAGQITGLEVLGIPASAGSGDMVFEVVSASRPINSGLGSGTSTDTATVAATTAVTTQTFSITLATPKPVTTIDDTVIIRLSRLGGDAADTYAADFMVISVRLLFDANVADSDNPDYRYGASDDVATTT